MAMEPLFSVVTIFTSSDGKKIVHSYGPYTEQQANYQRRRMLEMTKKSLNVGDTFHVHTTKILDPERISPFIWGKDPSR